ncbi:MAG TPA: hypothetical protein VNB94_00485 [Mycobacteriales bacterium]|nr:hypothetical protein [Mycobacteriales bacterium]
MTTTTSTTTAPATALPTPSAVDRLLEAIATGRGGTVAALFADDALLDATVPGWRFRRCGGRAVATEYASWFASPARFEELDRLPVQDGEIVTYLLTWLEYGVPWAAHHCHRLTLDANGRICGDRVFCGGRWDAALLARMEQAQVESDEQEAGHVR